MFASKPSPQARPFSISSLHRCWPNSFFTQLSFDLLKATDITHTRNRFLLFHLQAIFWLKFARDYAHGNRSPQTTKRREKTRNFNSTHKEKFYDQFLLSKFFMWLCVLAVLYTFHWTPVIPLLIGFLPFILIMMKYIPLYAIFTTNNINLLGVNISYQIASAWIISEKLQSNIRMKTWVRSIKINLSNHTWCVWLSVELEIQWDFFTRPARLKKKIYQAHLAHPGS